MAETIYNWPVLLDPPGAVDVGNNSYRIGNGPAIPRTILTTVAHVSEYPPDSRHGPGASIYSDGTVRRPDLSIIYDLRANGERVSLGGVNPTTGRAYTTNDTPRNPDGSPFQWGRAAALQGAGIAPQVDAAYTKGGVDLLASPVPINSGNPITFGPYLGLFPDANGGTTLLDANGIVRVRDFDFALYFKRYSPVQYDANGMQISNVTAPDYRSYADDGPSLTAKPPVDAAGWSPVFDDAPISTTGGTPLLPPAPAPNLTGISASAVGASPVPMATAPKDYTKDKTMWVALGIVVLAAFGLSKKGR